jgi:transcription termination factor Rho
MIPLRMNRQPPGAGGAGPALEEGRGLADLADLFRAADAELGRTARAEDLEEPGGLERPQLVLEIVRARARRGAVTRAEGTLEVLPDGSGFLRSARRNYLDAPEDVHLPAAQVRRLGLRAGVVVRGVVRPPQDGRPACTLAQVESVDGDEPERAARRPHFDELTPLHPDRRLTLEGGAQELGLRVLNLLAPAGKGQRGLLVAPPRAGKTVLLQGMARALLRNHPECDLFVLLIDERPEEVTDMLRTVAGPAAEVVASTFDRPPAEHLRVAEMVLAKARRRVEAGRDAVILLDSVTRLARAYNAEAPCVGRSLSGGLTAGALDRPKRFFGAARNVEEGGSLTILATALIDTGSRMDEVIFEEFKGTGNMELHLDRRLVDKRVWPAVNVGASGTRREELLLGPEELRGVRSLRKGLAGMHPVEAMELLTGRLAKTVSNAAFLKTMRL